MLKLSPYCKLPRESRLYVRQIISENGVSTAPLHNPKEVNRRGTRDVWRVVF